MHPRCLTIQMMKAMKHLFNKFSINFLSNTICHMFNETISHTEIWNYSFVCLMNEGD